jgi:anti-sigma B factor antagonist
MHGFNVTTTRIDSERVLVSVFGEADLSGAPEFGRELTKTVETGPRLVVIDLQETTFIDSTGLRVLIQARKRLEALGGRICFVCPDRSIWKIFEITGLVEVFSCYPTVSEALSGETELYAAVADVGWDGTHAPADVSPATIPVISPSPAS